MEDPMQGIPKVEDEVLKESEISSYGSSLLDDPL
jgi:hypothetical protein